MRAALWPVKQFINWSDKIHLPERLDDFLSNEEKTAYLIPYVAVVPRDGFGGGIMYNHTNLFRENKKLSLGASAFLSGSYSLTASFDKKADLNSAIFTKIRLRHRRDGIRRFFGIGPDSLAVNQTRFSAVDTSGTVEFGWKSRKFTPFSVGFIVGYYNRYAGTSTRGLSLESVFDPSSLPAFRKSLQGLNLGVRLLFDFRNFEAYPFKGGTIELLADGIEFFSSQFAYYRFKGQTTYLIPLSSYKRVLGLRLFLESVEGFGKRVPFYLLSSMGGPDFFRSELRNRYLNRGTIGGSIEYRYRVWERLQPDRFYGLGFVFLDVGRGFTDYEEIFRGKYRYSLGTGVMVSSQDSFVGRVQVGFGEEGGNFEVSFTKAF